MSIVYKMGVEAAAAGELASTCPYRGHNKGSAELKRVWLQGYEFEMGRRLRALGRSKRRYERDARYRHAAI